MKHHYIPQFYLREFTDPDIPEGYEPYVWLYSPEKLDWEKRAPKNIAAETDYYCFPDKSGSKRDDVEKLLSQMESEMAIVIQKILKEKQFNEEERDTFAAFVMLMSMRTPGRLEQIQNAKSKLIRKILEVQHAVFKQDPKNLEHFKKRYRQDIGSANLDEMSVDDLDPTKYRIEVERWSGLGSALECIEPCALILARMGWTFYISQPPDYFITSDNPFHMVNPTNRNKFFGNGLLSKNIEVSLPLARNLGFLAGWQFKGTKWLLASCEIVKQFNYRSGLRASRFLVSPKPNFPGSEHL